MTVEIGGVRGEIVTCEGGTDGWCPKKLDCVRFDPTDSDAFVFVCEAGDMFISYDDIDDLDHNLA